MAPEPLRVSLTAGRVSEQLVRFTATRTIACRPQSSVAGGSKGGSTMIWLLVLVLLLLAIGGGVAVSKFLFLVLLVALIVALLGARRPV
jgi:hypothetical protein